MTAAMPCRLLLAATGLCMLAGCGFALRGEVVLPPDWMRVHVASTDRELVARLTDEFAGLGATMVKSVNDAAAVTITAADFRQTTLTTDSAGRANAYRLRYEVAFTATGNEDASAQTYFSRNFFVERVFDYDPARQLQSEAETRFLKTNMRSEAAARIVELLAAAVTTTATDG